MIVKTLLVMAIIVLSVSFISAVVMVAKDMIDGHNKIKKAERAVKDLYGEE
jgi:hypothetical protein